MVADYFTKPLQGKQFYKFHDEIMNIGPNCKHHLTHRSVLKDKEDVTNDVVENNVANNDLATLFFDTKSIKATEMCC
jgi:uncharacterized Zn ribbon protein